MLAIGFLSLLSVGFVAMSMGGDDDAPEIEQEGLNQDDVEIQQGDVGIEFFPSDDYDQDQLDAIDEFVESVEDNPQQDIGDVVDDLHDLLDDLEIDTSLNSNDEAAEAENAAETQDAPDVARPPVGEEFRDPLKVAEALEAQRILDEIAAEEARQPVNLVTVSNNSGSEVPDDVVLAERASNADPNDPAFTVTAPETVNEIEVRYDAEHTFDINYNAQTTSVTAGLNSDIEGAPGYITSNQTTQSDAEGNAFNLISVSQTFEGSTDITLDVEDAHIGTHIAKIDLTNPADTLHLEFGEEVDGDIHLLFYENEDGEEGDSSTTKRAFVIQTSAGGPAITSEEFAQLLATDNGQMTGIHIIAEVYLGEDSIAIETDVDEGEPYEMAVNNFINDNPQITSNISWTSVETQDDRPEEGTAQNGGQTQSGGSPDADIEDLFGDIGLNPGFFGF